MLLCMISKLTIKQENRHFLQKNRLLKTRINRKSLEKTLVLGKDSRMLIIRNKVPKMRHLLNRQRSIPAFSARRTVSALKGIYLGVEGERGRRGVKKD